MASMPLDLCSCTYPLAFEHSKWMVLSSIAMGLPALVPLAPPIVSRRGGNATAASSVEWLLAAASLVTAAASINYWRDARFGTRRNVDLVVAKVSFFTFFVTGVQVLSGSDCSALAWRIGWLLAFGVVSSYITSLRLFRAGRGSWIGAHVCMHLCIAAGMTLVVVHVALHPVSIVKVVTLAVDETRRWRTERRSLRAGAASPQPHLNPTLALWGPATMDWCEENFQTTRYIAEFWNCTSNCVMVGLALFGVRGAYRAGVRKPRFYACFFGLLAVGAGSALFHGTLLYLGQLLDEIPMIWASCAMCYAAGAGMLLFSPFPSRVPLLININILNFVL